MHKSFKTFGLASAAMALALTPAMVAAQDEAAQTSTPPSMPETGAMPETTPPTAPDASVPNTTGPDTTAPSMPDTNPVDAEGESAVANADAATTAPTEAERDGMMQSWPVEQRTAYNTWSPETQNYFWTLNQERQGIFWRIADGDKTTLAAMAEPQREATWVELETRLKTMEG